MLRAIERAREIGVEHGESAAGWWEQDAIGGRARAGSELEEARRVLELEEAGDPQLYDSIPQPDLSGEWADGYTVRKLMVELGVPGATLPGPGGDPHVGILEAWLWAIVGADEDELADAYCEGFDQGCRDAIVKACKALVDAEEAAG